MLLKSIILPVYILGSKGLRQLDNRTSQIPTISTLTREFNVYVLNFSICLHFTLTETEVLNSFEELSLYIYIYIYIYICRKTDNNDPSGRNDLLTWIVVISFSTYCRITILYLLFTHIYIYIYIYIYSCWQP